MSGAPSRVFIARLAGLAVFDPTGDQVGKVRDVVVTLRIGRQPPRVLGLVVEVFGRRRVFLPIGRVTALDAGKVITTGLVNMRRFEQRATETLVLGELLDRSVTLVEDGTTVTVEDVAMEETRLREWLVAKVFVSRPAKGLRRRGETLLVDWDAVTGFSLAEEGQGAANLLATFEKLRPADLAQVMHDLSPKRRLEVAAALADEQLADVLEEMTEDDQVEILGKLEEERAADVLEAMDPDDAADLLSELQPHEAEKLLELMEPEDSAPLRRLLAFGDDTAGGMMTTEPVILAPDATVAEALARVRNPELSTALASMVYVVRPPLETPTGKYLGIAHIQRLLREPPSTLVAGIVDNGIEPVRPETPLAAVTRHLATYNLVAVPVVDEADHLVGVVSVDDVLDHLLPDDWRQQAADEPAGAQRGA
ncbi:magnesium transporter MgtE N-terminal domain-containing protein [Vallicoccus soli]|uniref:CBS domain-containing protein n=1 Tax=Vallicoccus soli TaxID=2339232 RepID=A0A3A3Z4Y7_9ACTN|nr:CBS domain-containing protein [Vallicoccus soli]RJK98043.1 CBS domain-containing protein [Vallicoccus soli]